MDPITVPVTVDAVSSSLLHDLIQFGISICTLGIAILAAYKGFTSEAAAKRSEDASKANTTQIHELKINVDGRLSQLLELNKVAAFAAGQKDEAAAGVARSDAAAVASNSYPPPTSTSSPTVHDVIPVTEGNELIISAADASVESDKTGEGNIVIKASEAKVESKGKDK